MFRQLLLIGTLALSLSSLRLLQSQELSTQAFANNFGDERLTQVEGNVRSDREESHVAGFNQSQISSNSDTLLHGQLLNGDALAGSETVSRGTGKGLSQTQNESFSREVEVRGDSNNELKAFLDKFAVEKDEERYIRSIEGVATDGFKTDAGSYQKIRNEGESTKRAAGAQGTAKYGTGVAGQLSAIRNGDDDNSIRNDTATSGEDIRVAVRENNQLDDENTSSAGAAFADSNGPNPASASSGSVALEGDGVINAKSSSEAKEDIAKARTYVTSNEPKDWVN